MGVKKRLTMTASPYRLRTFCLTKCPLRLSVRTAGSQPVKRSSTLLGGAIVLSKSFKYMGVFSPVVRLRSFFMQSQILA